jgi:hypothetical protein
MKKQGYDVGEEEWSGVEWRLKIGSNDNARWGEL